MFALGVPELLIILLALVYTLPTIVAFARRHHQRFAILLLNLFIGWTIFGWVAALVWAATAVSSDSKGAWQASGEQRFYAQCGAPMRIDASFCAQCGARRGYI
jgi:cytochrome c biogenesis protein CcdA